MSASRQSPLSEPAKRGGTLFSPEAKALAQLIEQWLGLKVSATIHRAIIDAALRLVAAKVAPSLAWLVEQFKDSPEHPASQALIHAASIGETALFRYPKQMKVLEEVAIAHLLPSKMKAGDKRLKAWSAGCATGEEAFTLAIMLKRIAPSFSIQVIGSDMNPVALTAAREGAILHRHHRERLPEDVYSHMKRDGDRWRFSKEIQGLVKFVQFNLATQYAPAPTLGLESFDIVLCRNVLIYIDPQKVQNVMKNLSRAARPRCVVALTPTEFPAARYLDGFQRRPLTLFVRGEPTRPDPQACESPPERGRPATAQPGNRLASSTGPRSPRSKELKPALDTPAIDVEGLIARAKEAANRGDYVAAEPIVAQVLAAAPHATEAYYLRALIRGCTNDPKGAQDDFRRVLFFDRNDIAAELGLAAQLSTDGQREEARRHYKRALRLLLELGADDIVRGLGVSVAVARRVAKEGLR